MSRFFSAFLLLMLGATHGVFAEAGIAKKAHRTHVENIGFLTDENCDTEACKKSPVLILSIDGASVRGLAQLYILQALEAKIKTQLGLPNVKLTDLFDVYAGTSAGAINVTALLTPSNVPEKLTKDATLPNGISLLPRYELLRPVKKDEVTGETIDEKLQKLPIDGPHSLDAIRENHEMDLTAAADLLIARVFKVTPHMIAHKLRVAFGLTGAKFDHMPLENLLKAVTTMGVIDPQNAQDEKNRVYYRMADTVKPAVLTAWDARNSDLFLFSTFDACQHPNDPPEQARNKEMWFASRTASAGPTYFNPTSLIENIGDEEVRRVLMDAGLIVMSPALLGLVEAMRIYPNRRYIVVSLSGGVTDKPTELETEGPHAAGLVTILRPAIVGAVEGGPLVAERVLSMLPNVLYLRINFDVNNKKFEDASDQNLAHIKQAAFNTMISKRFKTIVDEVARAYREKMRKKDFPHYTKCVFPKDALTDAKLAKEQGRQNVWSMRVSLPGPPKKKARVEGKASENRGHIRESVYAHGRPVSTETSPLHLSGEALGTHSDEKRKHRQAGRFKSSVSGK